MEDHLVQKILSMMNNKPKEETNWEKLFEENLQQMINNGGIPIKNESKDEEIATKKINVGNKMISIAPLNEVIKIYNEAVAYALPGSEVLARAFANRSAVLTNGAMYEDSLKDIERTLKIGYPDNLKAKLYARKAKNLLALNQKMCPEVEEAIAQANMWIEKMDDSNKKKVLSSLDQLQTQSLKKPVKKWDDSLFMPKITSENPKILRASHAIDIQQSEKFGRQIVATKDIKAGEAVVIHKAYSTTLLTEYWHTFCWNCVKFTFSCVPCNQCTNFVYCDENCRDEAWEDHHEIECQVINSLVAYNKKNIEVNLVSLRLLIRALKEYGNVETLYKKVQDLEQIEDTIDKSLTGGIFDDSKYASIYALLRKDINLIESELFTRKSIETLYMLAATTEIFGKKINKMSELKNMKYAIFIAKLLIHHIAIARTNSMMMMPNDDKGNMIRSCGVLLSLLSLFNHSCDCNAYQYASGNISAVVTLQPIKKGEQICISYGMYYRDAPTQVRRQSLKLKHHFWCKCMPCNKNWNPNYKQPSCIMQNGARKNVHKLVSMIQKYDKFPPIVKSYQISTRDKSPTDILRTITEITDLLNSYGKYFNYPCAEIEQAKNLLLNILHWVGGY
ncbi:GSCOCG00007643001-RA-CDS [Cotesia congregata]|uniref:Similar to Smyd4: SET and MYND domain-containing protein 4 (Mus musculus) n=1 Tax=Cotesia congregata TaxID=51543 RepID=A0A8J2HLW2_COTCN|nr:GSCOCG00007643001-RA-CDS [Cotesia congregata]CAG5096997.1 Similar to Smyd4: SET and MYND domain-containing protein 4 (Mus musculus) [Cotesia congregata]